MPPADSTGDGHLVRVAAEVGDVVPDPAQRRLLVLQSVVADVAGRPERRMGQEPQRAEPIVDGDDDDVAPRDQPPAVVGLAAAAHERAAVDPHHHRPRRSRRRRRPHVEGQAVLVALPAELRVCRRGPGCSAVPGLVASRTPVQAGACAGGRKRSGPTGGAA